jgi:pimeloyl-ACP methyl ester carboxylesterase
MALIGDIMTKKTKEAIKASAAIVIAVLAVIFLWIYPLNQAGKIVNRPDTETPAPNPEEYGLAYDTVSFLTEDNIPLSGMILTAAPKTADSIFAGGGNPNPDSIRGMAILLHGLFDDASSQLDKAAALVKAGFRVVIYDQRGYGQSGGKHRAGGYYEGNDLQEVLYTLNLEDRLRHPLIVWGEDHGGTAALKAWAKDERIDYVIAENPVVNGRDWQKRVRDHDRRSAPNFMMGLIWWWMKQKSGYEMSAEGADVSDAFGLAIVNHPDSLLMIACGENDVPDNPYLAELKEMGGNWLVLSCPSGESLFAAHADQILPAVLQLVE